jgi:hypothetical protein
VLADFSDEAAVLDLLLSTFASRDPRARGNLRLPAGRGW